MASDRPEQTITLPAELVRKCAGFSFDIGGSVMKVVYRTKEDFDDAMGKQEDDAVATVRLVSFSRQELQEAVEFIKANAYITRTPGEDTQVYTTGVGGFQFKAMMEEGLNVKNINIPEQDCIINSLRYLLKTMPREQLLHPFDESAAERPMAEMKAMFDVFIEGLKKGQTNVSVPGIDIENATGDTILKGIVGGLNQAGDPAKPMTEQKEDIYPVAMGIFGSAFGVIRIEKDGTYSAMEISPRGGRACLAMACLFLDCKDFNEFLELAKKGDEDNVDWCFRDMGAESLAAKDGKESDSNEDDMYSAFSTTADDKNNPLLVCFGQGVAKKKGDFKREDLAAALMRFFCNDLAMVIDSTLRQAMHGNVKHFFVAGGFPNNTLSRHMITRELTTRLCMKMFSNPTFEPYQLHFLQHGQHLGCIGGLINTVDHFIKPAPTPGQ